MRVVARTVAVTVAECGVPRLEQANGAILEAVAQCSREHGRAGKRCRSVCAQTDLESPPNTQCVSQEFGRVASASRKDPHVGSVRIEQLP